MNLPAPARTPPAHSHSRVSRLGFALLCVALMAGWQALTVHFTYHGNWTSLFCSGVQFNPLPPPLDRENVFLFPSVGYDGQMYHYIAHDPFLRRGSTAYLDSPRLRYRRILVPLIAHLLALRDDRRIDAAYFATIWLFIFLGSFWLGSLAVSYGHSARWALAFALVPAVLISVDRMTVDVALAAFSVGFVLYAKERALYQLFAVLTAAPLDRETGLLFPAAFCVYLLGEWRFSKSPSPSHPIFKQNLLKAAIFSLALLPAACWYIFVQNHTPPDDFSYLGAVPFMGFISRVLHPFPYTFGGPVRLLAWALDLVALAGVLGALCWAAYLAWVREWTPQAIAIYLFALLTISLSRPDAWSEVYAFGRTLTPLFLLVSLTGFDPAIQGSIQRRLKNYPRTVELRPAALAWLPALPTLVLLPRMGLNFGSQILKVLGGIFA